MEAETLNKKKPKINLETDLILKDAGRNTSANMIFKKDGFLNKLIQGNSNREEGNRRVYERLNEVGKPILKISEIFINGVWKKREEAEVKFKTKKPKSTKDLLKTVDSNEFDLLTVEEKNESFLETISEHLYSIIAKDFIKSGFSKEDFDYLIDRLKNKYGEREREIFLSIPASIREKEYVKWADKSKEYHNSHKVIDELLSFYVEKDSSKFFGYHTSTDKISRDLKTGDWEIIPRINSEDHRNNNLPMAYYSVDFKNLYFDKHSRNYIYLIRADTKKDYQDGDHAWGRNSKLSIIAEFDTHQIMYDLYKKNYKDKKYLV